MPDIDTTIVFFGTLLYVITVLVGFFIINEMREANKNFKKILALLFHATFLSASRDSANAKARRIKAQAFDILSKEFPEEFDQISKATTRRRANGSQPSKPEEFEGLPLNDLL